MKALFTIRGETDGSNTSGVFKLASELFRESVDYIRLEKGIKAKIWCKRIAGAPVTVNLEFTHDVTVSTPSWSVLDTQYLASSGELILEKRRPIIIHGKTGKEAIRITWSQSTAAKSYIEYEIELTDEEVEND